MKTSHIPAVDSGAYPLRPGNRVRPLIGGEPAFRRICEAVEGARKSVWVSVAFLDPDLQLPDGRGHLFDVLSAAAERGIDVRALIWRCPEAEAYGQTGIYQGTEEDHQTLRARGARFHARWDRLDKLYCHHQKSWLVDAGTSAEVAFVGGINLGTDSVTAHPFAERDTAHTQDIYCELQGSAATDVHHNFVQRWNGASEKSLDLGAWPSPAEATDLDFPHELSAPAGDTWAQVTRTIRRGFYRDETPTPGGKPFPIGGGEHSVFDQYVAALDAARDAIYIENQGFLSPEIVLAVERALDRNVEVGLVVPAVPGRLFKLIRQQPRVQEIVPRIVQMADRPNCTLMSIAADRPGKRYEDVYVHTKAAIVDDEWATIGSTNIIDRSFYGDSELNVSFWGREPVERFRTEILSLHHGESLDGPSFASALRALGSRAIENQQRRLNGDPLEGFTCALDAAELLG